MADPLRNNYAAASEATMMSATNGDWREDMYRELIAKNSELKRENRLLRQRNQGSGDGNSCEAQQPEHYNNLCRQNSELKKEIALLRQRNQELEEKIKSLEEKDSEPMCDDSDDAGGEYSCDDPQPAIDEGTDRNKGIDYVERCDNLWMTRYSELMAYKEEHGDCNVPSVYEINPQLGNWVNNQRLNFKNGKVRADRVEKLNEIGFTWKFVACRWMESYSELVKYKEEHGNCNVPQNYKTKLGKWVSNQRLFFKNGNLLADRVAKLNEIDFTWEVRAMPTPVDWSVRFGELMSYYEQHGNCNVPSRCKQNPQLGAWVIRQRASFKKGKLSADRVAKLNEIGFAWGDSATTKS